MVYVIIATTLVCVLFDPVIPTSSFNFIKNFILVYIILDLLINIKKTSMFDVPIMG